MLLMFFNLIQTQRRVPWLVWAAVGLIFVAGLALFVYFLKRMKKVEKEAEKEWSLTHSSLFIKDEPNLDDAAQIEEEPEPLAPEPLAPLTLTQLVEVGSTDTAEDEPTEMEIEALIIEPQKVELQPPPIAEPQPVTEPLPAEKEPARVEQPAMEEAPVFDDEVWAALEEVEREAETAPLASEPPRGSSARKEHRATIEPLIAESKRWETPMIEPVTPREESTSTEQKPSPGVESLEREPQMASIASTAEAPQVEAMTTRVKPGSILGIPDEPSAGPLILGEPQRDESEAGITSLSGYGRINESSGKWGTVTLVATVLVLAGLVFAYVRSPWFHEKINSIFVSFRSGEQVESPQPPKSDLPRAQIFPARSQPVKNMAQARGAVYNISGEPLTGLSLEVTLERGDGSSEARTVELKPNQLASGQQAIYEFEYDGRQFTGYRVSKLLSDSVEVKFIMPSRSQ